MHTECIKRKFMHNLHEYKSFEQKCKNTCTRPRRTASASQKRQRGRSIEKSFAEYIKHPRHRCPIKQKAQPSVRSDSYIRLKIFGKGGNQDTTRAETGVEASILRFKAS